jgi:hypothetical protein
VAILPFMPGKGAVCGRLKNEVLSVRNLTAVPQSITRLALRERALFVRESAHP